MVGIIGRDEDAASMLYSGLKEFPSEKVLLVYTPESEKRALNLKKDLEKIKLSVVTDVMANSALETVFQTIYKICNNYRGEKLVLNIQTDGATSCIALSAAFVNGIQAIGVNADGHVVAYPIMKFSYYSALSEKKMELLRKIEDNHGVQSLEELSGLSKMSLPLVTYHIRGSKSSPGLEELGLVELARNKGRVEVKLTSLGKLVLGGYVEVECNTPQCEKESKAHGKRSDRVKAMNPRLALAQ